jgi:hypothetical protein
MKAIYKHHCPRKPRTTCIYGDLPALEAPVPNVHRQLRQREPHGVECIQSSWNIESSTHTKSSQDLEH